MASTSDNTDEAKPLKTDRRVDLGGGLNTRASPLTIAPNKATALGNFRFSTDGALQKRTGGRQLTTIPPYATVAGIPVAIVEDAGATGTLAAGTYTVVYVMGTVSSATGKIGPSAASAGITVAVNHSISILIPSVNSGEGFGSLTNGYNDEPQNSGFLLSGANFGIYVKKTGDPNFTLQVVSDFGSTPLGPPPTPPQNGHLFNLASYTTSGAVAPGNALAPIPVRALVWNPLIDTLVGVSGETPYALQGALTSPQYMALSKDSANNPFGFSRLPTRIASTIIDRCMIFSDAVGRPKILDSPASSSQIYGVSLPTSWSFRQLGAAPPAAAPGGVVAAGTLNGIYQYVVTFVYQRNRQDGTNFLSESNSSPILNTGNLVNKQVTVSIPAPSESGIVSWNIYRTISGGTQFFMLYTNPIATLSIIDNLADSNLTGQQPPDLGGKVANDMPPQGLAMVTEHAGRGFGVQSNVLRKSGGGSSFSVMIRTRATNVVQYSKVRFINDLVGLSALILTLPGDFGNLDAWPSLFNFPCGNGSPITNMVSFRGVLYVFKEDEIGVIEGSTDQDFGYRTIWSGTGAMENSVIKVGNYLMAFDQALGPIVVSGYSVTDMGYNTIQKDWVAPVTTVSGEAVAGGGRGSTGVISATWDPVNSEARWVISDYQTDPASGTGTGATPTFFEYVCEIAAGKPGETFTRFTGAVNGTTVDRRILAQTPCIVGSASLPFRPRDVVFGDYHGRLVDDNQLESDLDGVSATAISIRATFPYFFGDNPEIVKQFRYLYGMFVTGSNVADAINVVIQSLSKDGTSPVSVTTINGAAATAGINLLKRIDLPASLDGTNNKDRGMQVVITGSAQSGPLLLEELTIRYQDAGDRSKP